MVLLFPTVEEDPYQFRIRYQSTTDVSSVGVVVIIKRSILYSAYGYYQVNHSMKGTVVREHCSKRRSSRPFAGYNHERWFKKSLS
jgi:hypothetical protein